MTDLFNKVKDYCMKHEYNTLYLEVCDWLETYDCDDDGETLQSYLNDLCDHGCASGMVNSLIYYDDTITFYNKHKYIINRLLVDLNITAQDLNGYDKDDPLCLEQNNQNLLAWFAFEECARDINNYLNMEDIDNDYI
jgi:hypothetical protein